MYFKRNINEFLTHTMMRNTSYRAVVKVKKEDAEELRLINKPNDLPYEVGIYCYLVQVD